ncbi:MAG: D-alanine--D-alanine ligase [Alphaproteobacteria bacterium]|nr:D-alanine--D-alanine ligase [Alphaproteobacteria bacterium]
MHDPKNTHVLLLEGGWNAEKEVSLSSGQSIYESLIDQGYPTTRYNPTRDIKALCSIIETVKPDVIFNGLHGIYFEDGRLQGLLDILGVPYTHSSALASAIGMHKPTTKNVLSDHNVPVPPGKVCLWDEIKNTHPMDPPYVVKPIDEGSSVGVYIIQKGDAPVGSRVQEWPYNKKVLVEKYIPGQEISVAVMDKKAIGILELRPKAGFYDYKAKYTDGMTDHIMPADIPATAYKKAMSYAEEAHNLLGCDGVTRSDFRYDTEKDELYLLEVNTQPGFTKLSIVPEICAYYGISFNEIVRWLIQDGLWRASNDKNL